MKTIWFATAALSAASAFASDQPALTAKALFFGTDGNVMSVPTAPVQTATEAKATGSTSGSHKVASRANKQSSPIGASYFIRMKNPDGSTRNVLASRVFRSGERFQLGVKVNHPTYVYILNTDPTGKVTQLYPQPGQENFIDAMGVVFLPSQGAFQFDNNPGDERLSVYLSPKPVSDLVARLGTSKPDLISDPLRVQASADASCTGGQAPTQVAMADIGEQALTSKGIEFAPAPSCAPAPLLASKAIVFSDDANPSGGQVSSYVVKQNSKPSETLHLELRLIHR
jgi:hypothetical protein